MKKIIVIGIIYIFLTPIGSVTGINQNITKDKEIYYTNNIQQDITNLLNDVNESIISYYLEKFVSFGFKKTGSENASRTADWIKNEFKNIGLYTYFDEWKFPKYKDKNVIAVHNGTDSDSDAVILISAHYDTIGKSHGANDDGSGIAAMLTIANITINLNFNHSIRFIAVSGEEVGTYGSFYDARKSYLRGENIIAVLNIDMIGYANQSDEHIVQIFTQSRSEWIVELAEEMSEKYQNYFNIIPQHSMHYPADYESYYDLGFDGVQITQCKPEDAHWFHTPNDTLDKITYNYLANVTKLVLTMTCELAFKPIDVQVKITRPKEAYIYIFDFLLIRLPCYNLYTTRLRAITYLYGKTTVKLNITTDEEINSVYFGIDGYIIHIVKKPPYEWKIGTGLYGFFNLKGFHRITVCVTTNTGKTAQDEMDVYIVKML